MIEDKIQEAIKPIISIYNQIELDIIERIAEHFKLNEEFINIDYWYLEKLKEMGVLNNQTMKLLEKNIQAKTKQELLKSNARYRNRSNTNRANKHSTKQWNLV